MKTPGFQLGLYLYLACLELHDILIVSLVGWLSFTARQPYVGRFPRCQFID